MPGDRELQFQNLLEKTAIILPTLTIGVIKETKTPPDSRVPLTPEQCRKIMDTYSFVKIIVQSSEKRCFSDDEYRDLGVEIHEGPLVDCDVLIGVKEVVAKTLIPDKTYFFFSHTIKKQPYNRSLLQTILQKNIRLVDYECIVDDNTGKRVIAFGRWAGIVGAHNTIYAYGKKSGEFDLPRLHKCIDFHEGKQSYREIDFRGIRVVLTGTGRVANGSAEVLDAMGFRKVSTTDFLNSDEDCYSGPIYVQLRTRDIFGKQSDDSFDSSFYETPQIYRSLMMPYLRKANILINGIYWDFRAPQLFQLEDMKSDDFRIRVIGDITCDIAPESSIPCTLRPSTIGKPVFGYDIESHSETNPYLPHTIDMMTVDNLPNELPRDASADFGNQFLNSVMLNLVNYDFDPDNMLDRASIAVEGHLNSHYDYLHDYVY